MQSKFTSHVKKKKNVTYNQEGKPNQHKKIQMHQNIGIN